MVEFVTQQLTPSAMAAGQVSGRKAASLGNFGDALQGAANGFSAFYEHEAGMQRERLMAQAQADWSRTFSEKAPEAGAGFAAQTTADYKAYVEKAMSGAPLRGKDDLQLAFDKYGLDLETRALAVEAAARARATAAMAAETKAARGAAIASAKRMRGNALVSDPSLAAEFMAADPENAEYYDKLSLDRRMIDDPDGVAAEVMSGSHDEYLSPSEKLAFVKAGNAAVERGQRDAATANAVDQQGYLSGLDEEVAYTAANGHPPVDSGYDPATVDALYGPLPGMTDAANAERAAQGAEVKRRYETAIQDAETLAAVNVATPEALGLSISEAVSSVQAPGRTAEDVSRLASLQKAVETRNAAIVADSAAFVTQTSDETKAWLNAYNTVAPEQRAASAAGYQAAATSNYSHLGVPDELRRVMPKDIAAAQAKMLNEAPAATAALVAQQFLADWNNPRVAAELTEAGLAPEIGVAMRRADNPGLMAEITNLRGVPKDQLVAGAVGAAGKAAPADVDVAMQEALADYGVAFTAGGGPAAAATMAQNVDVATKLALKYVSQGMDPAAAGAKAALDVFPETPINEAHIQLIAPVGVTEWQVSQALGRAMTDEAIRAFAPAAMDNPNFPEFADAEIMIEAAQNGVWLNNSTGDGAVLHLNLGGYYLPVVGSNGRPYEMKFNGLPSGGAPRAMGFGQ